MRFQIEFETHVHSVTNVEAIIQKKANVNNSLIGVIIILDIEKPYSYPQSIFD